MSVRFVIREMLVLNDLAWVVLTGFVSMTDCRALLLGILYVLVYQLLVLGQEIALTAQ